MAGSASERDYALALLVLTAAAGAADGVSYVALDSVFTGNMTGNVLFIGFGMVGVEGINLLNNVVALMAFLLGVLACALLLRGTRSVTRLHPRSLVVLLVGAALSVGITALWLATGEPGELGKTGLSGALAFVLGSQAAAVKPLGIRGLTTVVVTMTMIEATIDGVAGMPLRRLAVRVGAIVSLAFGGLLAALLALAVGGGWAMLACTGLLTAGACLLWLAHRRERRSVDADAHTAEATPTDGVSART